MTNHLLFPVPCSRGGHGTEDTVLPAEAYREAERYHLGTLLHRYQPSVRKTVRTLLFFILMAFIAFPVMIIDNAPGYAPPNRRLEWGRSSLFVISLLGVWLASLCIIVCTAELVTHFGQNFSQYVIFACLLTF